jgi:spore germination protein KB
VLGRALSFFYALFLSVGLVAIWAEFLILMRTPVLPLTPPWAVGILAALVAGVLVTTGPTGIARLNDLVVPAGVAVVAFLVLASNHRIDQWNHQPSSLSWQAAWLPVSFLGEVPIAAIFLDRVRSPSLRARRWALVGGALAAGGALLVAVVVSLGVLGPELVARLSYPFFEVVSEIRVGDFLTKNSLWLIVVGSLFLYVKLAIWVYAVAEGLRAAVGRGCRSAFAWGVVAITLAVALLGFATVGAARSLIWNGWAEVVFPSLVALTLASGLARIRRPA